jgi:hypothetical protein
MNGPGLPEPGRIQIFNNRLHSFADDRQTEVLEIDPHDGSLGGSVAWRYRSPGFFSPTSGTQQALPNGNVLITSTRGGRTFEVTRSGEIVWQWVPPYQPVRAVRVAPDACPQLTRLDIQAPRAVAAPSGYRHVDRDSYRFSRQGARMKAVVEGRERTVLKQESDCRELLLPAEARLQVGYGVDRDRLRAAGRADRPPEFAVHLRSAKGAKGESEVELLRDSVGLDGAAWRQRTLRLDPYGLQTVQLCIEVDGGARSTGRPGKHPGEHRFAYWEQPLIATPRDLARAAEADDDDAAAKAPADLTPEELEVRRKHLKALGYVG